MRRYPSILHGYICSLSQPRACARATMRSALSHLLALGPELAIHVSCLLAACIPSPRGLQSAWPATNLDFSQLEWVTGRGDFDSISLNACEGQNDDFARPLLHFDLVTSVEVPTASFRHVSGDQLGVQRVPPAL